MRERALGRGGCRIVFALADLAMTDMVRNMISRGSNSRLVTCTIAAIKNAPAIHFQFRAITRNSPS